MSTVGYFKIARNHTSFEGLSLWELRYSERFKQYVKPQIKERYHEFDFNQAFRLNPVKALEFQEVYIAELRKTICTKSVFTTMLVKSVY